MQLLLYTLIVALLLGAAFIFIRYEPRFDLVKSGNKYLFIFWYNKYDYTGTWVTREYIKLFEI